MADTFKVDIGASFGWLWQSDTLQPQDNDRLAFAKSLTNGEDDYEAEAKWSDEAASLLDGGTRTLDLTALTRTIFGDTHTVTLVRLKALMITLTEASTGQLLVGGAAADEWWYPFGAPGDKLYVPRGSVGMLTSLGCGWQVDNSHKNLKLAAVDGDITYSIAIVGTITVCTGTCSTSSF